MKTNKNISKAVQTRIRLPFEIMETLKVEAEGYGFSLSEWLNYILTEKALTTINQKTEAEEFARKVVLKYKLTPHNYPYVDEQKLEDLVDSLRKD